jgi:protein arginine kinase activator
MLCQSCKKNLATVHLTEIVQKTKKETHLCEECARKQGVTYTTQFSVKDFLGDLAKKKESSPAPKPPSKSQPTKPCPSCGISFSDFRQTGRLGCHYDYEHFKDELVPMLEKIHNGGTQHTGRAPERIGERIQREQLIARYQRELREAIDSENYERAAELRDQIKSIEQVGEAK